MKTAWLNELNIVIDVTVGTPAVLPPDGVTFDTVADDLYVGKGFQKVGDSYVDNRPKPEQPVEDISVISMRQCRLCLHRRGLLSEVDDRVKMMSAESQIEWNYSEKVTIDSPLTLAIASLFKYDDADIQGFFDDAATI